MFLYGGQSASARHSSLKSTATLAISLFIFVVDVYFVIRYTIQGDLVLAVGTAAWDILRQ